MSDWYFVNSPSFSGCSWHVWLKIAFCCCFFFLFYAFWSVFWKPVSLFFPSVCVCACSSDFITCKALIPGGAPLHSSVLRMGAVTGLRDTSRGELPLSVPRRLRRAMLQQNLPRRDKKPRQDSRPYQWSSTADRQKPTGIKILSFALPFLAFHFLLHWGFFWE